MSRETDLTKTRFRVMSRGHPHYGESGYFTGKMISLFGRPMAEMRLENCQHGTDGCFVSLGDAAVDQCQPVTKPRQRDRRDR